MPPDATDLKQISDSTINHYESRAVDFWEGTRDHDVTANIRKLLQYIDGRAPFHILDFGCGPGRDLKTFRELGHVAIGLDGATSFVAMARAFSDCEVWQQDFCQLDLPLSTFDGVFANAALFHVPSQVLPKVLHELYATLKPGGVLFSSNPRSFNEDPDEDPNEDPNEDADEGPAQPIEEGWYDDRYGTYYNLAQWRRMMVAANFIELTHYFRPDGLPREQQRWLASVWKKVSK